MADLHTRLAIDNTKNSADHGKSVSIADVVAFASPGGGSSGLVLISNGTITDPVEFLDISLPAGYAWFDLTISQMQMDAFDALGAAFGVGGTLLCDTEHSDSYFEQGVYASSSDPPNTLVNVNPLMDLNQAAAATAGHPAQTYIMRIFPGSAIDTAVVLYQSIARSHLDFFLAESGAQGVNPTATVAPTLQRMDLIRVLPFGFGDCDPPSSGEHLTSGIWTLLGAPAP